MIGRLRLGRMALALMAGTAGLYSGVAWAQASDAAGKKAEAASAKVEEVVVTGSRVRRATNTTSATPLTTVDAEQLKFSGYTNIAQVLATLPQVQPSVNNQDTGLTLFAAGQANIDIRGLGAVRTLVLVNGKRHQSGSFTSTAVDLNGFAQNYIDKVDVITGGASAAYGSEAISGVVNLITRKNLEGLELNTEGGISEKGDTPTYTINVSGGHRYLNDKAYSILSVEYSKEGPTRLKDRDFAAPAAVYNTTVVPNVVAPGQTITSVSPTGVFRGLNVAISLDRKSVNTIPLNCRAGAFGCTDNTDFVYGYIYQATEPVRRTVVNNYNEYAFLDNLKGTLEFEYSGVVAKDALSQPGFNSAQPIRRDNGFLVSGTDSVTVALRNAFNAAGLTQPTQSTNAGFFFDDIGQRISTQKRYGARVAVGLEGDFTVLDRKVKWDSYYTYGQQTGTTYGGGGYYTANLTNAFDSILDQTSGQVVCRSVTARANGCVPYDFIHGPSQAALNYVKYTNTVYGRLNQNVAAINLNTDLVELPAGPLGIAVGGEYRNEYLAQSFDPQTIAGTLFTNQRANVTGQFNVKEAFVEGVIPILKDLPFVKYLGAEVAGRTAEYSTAGYAKSYKAGGEYAPTEDIRFRSTAARSLRAPNLFELFSPLADNFTNVNDPCDRRVVPTAPNPTLRAANCVALIKPGLAGYDPASYLSGNNLSSTHLLQGGNPALKPEQGITFDAGAVVTPRWVPNLSVSADYFTTTIRQAVSTLPIATLYNFCFDSTSNPLSNPYCQLITRDFTGNSQFVNGIAGSISAVRLVNLNIAKRRTSGVDYEVNYHFALDQVVDLKSLSISDPGDLALKVNATNVQTWKDQSNPIALPLSYAAYSSGGFGAPRWKIAGSLTWSNNKTSFTWSTNYISDERVSNTQNPATITPYYYKANITHAISARYMPVDYAVFHAGITNLLNERPPLTLAGYSFNATSQSQYDVRGRYFTAGATLKY